MSPHRPSIRRIRCTALEREHPQHNRTRHTAIALWLAACCGLLLGAPRSVAAQSAGLTQHGPSWPDLTGSGDGGGGQGHAWFTLVFFVLTFPVYCASLVALWKQRGIYPLAGRGAGYLFLTNLCVAGASLVLTAITLAYTHSGPPCGLEFLAASVSVLPLSCCYMLRGFILIWRLEISNFLAELKRREADEHAAAEGGADDVLSLDDDAALTRQNTKHNAAGATTKGRGGLLLVAPRRETGGSIDCSSPISMDSPCAAASPGMDEANLVPGSVQLASYPVAPPSTVPGSAARSTVLGRAVSQSLDVSRREGVAGLRRFHADGSVASSAGNSPAVTSAAAVPRGSHDRDSIEVIALGEGLLQPSTPQPTTAGKDASTRTSLARQSSNASSARGNNFLLDPTASGLSASAPISLANTPNMGPLVSPVQSPPALFTRASATNNAGSAAIQPIEEEASSIHGRISGTPASTRAPSGQKSAVAGVDALGSIPGEWYLRHAHWIDRRNLCAVVSLFVGSIIGGGLAISLAGATDPDVRATNDEMVLRGERLESDPPLYHIAQLDPRELFYAAPCMLSSSKMLYLQGLIVGVILPLAAWIVFKLKQNMRRVEQRKKRSGRMGSVGGTQSGEPGAPASGDATLVSSLASIRGRYASSDTDAVKHELQLIGLVALALTVGYPLLTKWATRFIMFDVLGPLVAIEVISILTPVYVGWKIAREHRAFLHAQRLRSLQSGNVGAEAVHKLPHHRPFYRLKFILRSPKTFPVFLRFLEKEWSTENALFLNRVRLFEKSCRTLEARIPTFPKPGDEDGEAGAAGGVAAQHTLAHWKQHPAHGLNHTRAPTTFAGASNLRRSTNPRSLPGSTNLALRMQGGNRASLERPEADESGGAGAFDPPATPASAAASEAPTAPLLPADDMHVDEYDPADAAGGMEIIAPTPTALSPAMRSTVPPRQGSASLSHTTPSAAQQVTSPSAMSRHLQWTSPGMVALTTPGPASSPASPSLKHQPNGSNGGPRAQLSVRTGHRHSGEMRNGSGDFLASSGGSLHQTASSPASVNGSVNKLAQPRRGSLTNKIAPAPSTTAAQSASHHAHRQSTGSNLLTKVGTGVGGGGASNSKLLQHSGSSHLQSFGAQGVGGYNVAMLSKMFSAAELAAFHRSSQDLLAECRAIWETFLAPTAATPLNLDADLAALIAHQLQMLEAWVPTPLGIDGKPSAEAMLSTLPAPPPFPLSTLFRQTALTIYELVNRDSFRRFILTESFLDLLIQSDEAEMARTAQESSLQATTQAVIAEAKQAISMRKEDPAWRDTSAYAAAMGGSAMHSIYYPRGGEGGTILYTRAPHSLVFGGVGVGVGSRKEKSRQYAEGDDRDDLTMERDQAEVHSDDSPRSDVAPRTPLPPPPPRVKVALTAAAAASIATRSPPAGTATPGSSQWMSTPQMGPLQAPVFPLLSRSLPGSKRSSAEHPLQNRVAPQQQQHPGNSLARPPSITVSLANADASTPQQGAITTTSTAQHRPMLSSSLVVSVTSAAGETVGGSGGSNGNGSAAPLRPDRASASSSHRSRDREGAGVDGLLVTEDSPPLSPHAQQTTQQQQQHNTPSMKARNAGTSTTQQQLRPAGHTQSLARRAQLGHPTSSHSHSADSLSQPDMPPTVAIHIPQ